MSNNERLSAIRNSIKSIGKDLRVILAGFFHKSLSEAPQSAQTESFSQSVPAASVEPEKAIDSVESNASDEQITRVDALPEQTAKIEVAPVSSSPVPATEPVPVSQNLKVCSRCKVKKPLDNDHFHRDAHKISGFRSACRECSNGSIKQVSCNVCGVSKPLTAQFWQRNSKAKSGFRNPCKECLKKTKVA